MAVLMWKHGLSVDAVRQMFQQRLEEAGVNNSVVWAGNTFSATVGWGTILALVGEIQEEVIVVKKCSGGLSGVVLAKVRQAFEQMFPGGEVSNFESDRHLASPV